MAIIIDANRAGDFNQPPKHHAEEILKQILRSKVKVVVGGRLLRELIETPIRHLLVEWVRSGRAVRVDDTIVDAQETHYSSQAITSDDPHVLGLAMASNCRLLYTDDQALVADFKNIALLHPKGKVITLSTNNMAVCTLLSIQGG